MIPDWKKYTINYFVPLLILIVSAFVFLPNLGRHFLWQDEAQTALISRSILTSGIPYCHDDKNSFSQELGAESGTGGVYKWHPWIPFYIHAAFFQLFGQSDFAARLPDALFGIGTVLLCFWTVRSTGKGIRASLIAAGILMLMVPFLLLSRQCRYYSMVAFFSMGCILTYFLFLKSKKYARLLLVSSTVILFHIQMIYGAIFLATVLIHVTLIGKEYFKRMVVPMVGVLCFVLPWICYTSEISYQSRYSQFLFNPFFIKRFFFDFIVQLEMYVIPLYFIIFLLVIVIWHRKSTYTFLSTTMVYMTFYFLYAAMLVCILSLTAPNSFFRYLAPVLPLCAIAVAEIIELGFQVHPVVGSIGLVLFFLHQPMLNYYFELTHDFKGPMEGLVGHLRHHAQPSDTVAITYGDMPIKWYTGLHVIGGLTGENLEKASHARWVIFRKHAICEKDEMVAEYLSAKLSLSKYRKLIIDAPDTPYENREDPQEHLYRTATEEDRVIIYERIP
ncbi:MAG: glycosyltransferase family 39 protein [Ignavibacteriales bacterium]|nr:glycosyltransferase family 39 protein [Ignavibacteriales bacterium]